MDKSALSAAVALALSVSVTFAQTPQTGSSIDPNTFIVGHPASPTCKVAYSNGEHPAVLLAARRAATAPDSITFLIQPPASVRWVNEPQATALANVPR